MSSRRGFDRIIGQTLAKEVLLRAVRKNRPAHTYLFLGLQGTGKMSTAMEFAKALNCEQSTEVGACEECAICHSVEHKNFPDIRVWSPEKRDTSIKLMREMRDMATFRPMRGKWVVNIVEQGDTLNEESANCILKLLEEPPSYLINILLYRNAANILPTILSRSQLVRFEQVERDLLSQRLIEEREIDQAQADFLAAYSQGRPGMAIGLIGNTEFQAKRDNIVFIAKSAAAGAPWSALRLAEVLRSGSQAEGDDVADEDDSPSEVRAAGARKGVRDTTLEALGMLLVWYRDLLAVKTQGEAAPIVNVDRRNELTAQAARYSRSDFLLSAVEAILHTQRRIQGNSIPQIATEALMMKLCF